MEWDEPKAKQQSSAHQVGEPLDKLSMDELHARVEMLEKEIERLRSELSGSAPTKPPHRSCSPERD